MQSTNGSDSKPTEQSNNNRPQQKTPPPPSPHSLTVPPPQQWVPMQYPPAAMVMPHHMLPPQHYPPPPHHYMAYHHYLHHVPHVHHGSSAADNKTLWVGDLHHWMDENYLHRCFVSTGEVFPFSFFWFYLWTLNRIFFFCFLTFMFSDCKLLWKMDNTVCRFYLRFGYASFGFSVFLFFWVFFCYEVNFLGFVLTLRKRKLFL